MKSKQLLHYCSVATAMLLYFCSCTKPGGPGIPDLNYYRIDSIITRNDIAAYNDAGKVTYNAKGDPIRITFRQTSTSFPNSIFWYDNQGRLTDQIGTYDSPLNYFDTWHHYTYDRYSRVPKSDTVYEFAEIGPNGPLPDNRGKLPIRFLITFDKFDTQNRVLKYTIDNVGNIRIYNYYYNARGNAWKITLEENRANQYAKSQPTIYYPTYDDKVNPRLLHTTWQLSDISYSRNNPFTASSYNVIGLPSQVFGQQFDRAVLGCMVSHPEIKYRH